MAELKAVLFDLDDTLLDWSKFDGNYYGLELQRMSQLREYLVAQGYDVPVTDRFVEEFRDRSIAMWEYGRETMIAPHMPRILAETVAQMGVPEDAIEASVLLEQYNWGAVPGTQIFPEVPKTLETIIDAGIQIGIVTNAYQTMAMRDVEIDEHGILKYFPTCRFSAADVGYLKPHPAIFETAINCTQTSPEETVFVGDNLNADIVGAQRVGMRGVWRDTGQHPSRIALETVDPDATITALDQLLPILDDWYPGWRS